MARLPTAATALAVAASLLPLLAFLFPLWRYELSAPQYPEGITMTIWVNGLGGRLDLVNALNHYIGMRVIEASSFPELRYMPWIVGVVAVSGLLAAASRRLWALATWVAAFALLGIAGLADFQLRLYRYGHELSPDAPFEIDPFTPPIVGRAGVMNFGVSAYPDAGGIAIVAALLIGAAAVVLGRRRRGRPGGAR